MTGGMPCLLLEWAEGGSLQDWMQLRGRWEALDANTTWAVMQDMRAACAAFHKAGYVYRGLQPANVLLCRRPGTCSFSFKLGGLHNATQTPSEKEQCLNNPTVGTPGLLGPEESRQHQSSTWGLGMLLLSCRGGQGRAPPVKYDDVRASSEYTNLLPVEWDLVQVCMSGAAQQYSPTDIHTRTQ